MNWNENPHPRLRKIPEQARGLLKIDYIDEYGRECLNADPVLAFIGPQIIVKWRRSDEP